MFFFSDFEKNNSEEYKNGRLDLWSICTRYRKSLKINAFGISVPTKSCEMAVFQYNCRFASLDMKELRACYCFKKATDTANLPVMIPTEGILSIPTHNIDYVQFPPPNLLSVVFQSYTLQLYCEIQF